MFFFVFYCNERLVFLLKSLKCKFFEKGSFYSNDSLFSIDFKHLLKQMFVFGHTDNDVLQFILINYENIIYFFSVFNNFYFMLWFLPFFFIIFVICVYFFIFNKY